MNLSRLALTAAACAALVVGGCSDDNNGTGPGNQVQCNAGDPVCPPADLQPGFSGDPGAPTISTSLATSHSTATSAITVSGTTDATGNGHWLQVVNNELAAWGVVTVSGTSWNATVPLFCGPQELIVTFADGTARSYYLSNVTLTGCTSRAVRVQLVWDTGPDSDIDLHLLRPSGTMNSTGDCYYANCDGGGLDWGATGTAGDPFLDVDDVQGYGPENIVITSGAEAGTYRIVVHNFDDSPSTTARVRLFLNENEVGEWTSLTLDAASNRRYWVVASFDPSTSTVTAINTYSATAPASAGAAPPK